MGMAGGRKPAVGLAGRPADLSSKISQGHTVSVGTVDRRMQGFGERMARAIAGRQFQEFSGDIFSFVHEFCLLSVARGP